MRKAREALGEEARLVRARRVSGPDDPVPAYEVTASAGPTAPADPSASFAGLKREIEEMKEMLRARTTGTAPSGLTPVEVNPAIETWVDRLRKRGLAKSTAEELVQGGVGDPGSGDLSSAISRAVAAELESHSDARPIGRRSTFLVGPSGVGKTTTIAKLATELLMHGTRAILVTTDGESVSGEDTLARAAEALGLQMETAFFSGQLSTLAQGAGARDVLLIDTPGRSPWSADGLEGLDEAIRCVDDAEVLLVLPATCDLGEAAALAEAYRRVGAERVVFTKLDELARPGRLLDLARAIGLPIAWVTAGRESRNAAFAAHDPRVLARVLGSSGALEVRA